MKFINANKLHRKSGGMGHPALVRPTEGLNEDPLSHLRLCRICQWCVDSYPIWSLGGFAESR
jgi:hypothetical protein